MYQGPKMYWRMQYHVITFILRSRNQSDDNHRSHHNYCHYCWTPTRTGPQSIGLDSSTAVFSRLSPLHQKELSIRDETVPQFLSVIWSIVSLPSIGSHSLTLCSIPVSGEALRSHSQGLPSSRTLHPDSFRTRWPSEGSEEKLNWTQTYMAAYHHWDSTCTSDKRYLADMVK